MFKPDLARYARSIGAERSIRTQHYYDSLPMTVFYKLADSLWRVSVD